MLSLLMPINDPTFYKVNRRNSLWVANADLTMLRVKLYTKTSLAFLKIQEFKEHLYILKKISRYYLLR